MLHAITLDIDISIHQSLISKRAAIKFIASKSLSFNNSSVDMNVYLKYQWNFTFLAFHSSFGKAPKLQFLQGLISNILKPINGANTKETVAVSSSKNLSVTEQRNLKTQFDLHHYTSVSAGYSFRLANWKLNVVFSFQLLSNVCTFCDRNIAVNCLLDTAIWYFDWYFKSSGFSHYFNLHSPSNFTMRSRDSRDGLISLLQGLRGFMEISRLLAVPILSWSCRNKIEVYLSCSFIDQCHHPASSLTIDLSAFTKTVLEAKHAHDAARCYVLHLRFLYVTGWLYNDLWRYSVHESHVLISPEFYTTIYFRSAANYARNKWWQRTEITFTSSCNLLLKWLA